MAHTRKRVVLKHRYSTEDVIASAAVACMFGALMVLYAIALWRMASG